ncbi:hypothetical protein BH23GEM9_BH23GEM9_33620 [soil metagenome]
MDTAAEHATLAARLHAVAIHLLRRVRVEDEVIGLSASRLSALSVLVFGGARPVGELAAAEQVAIPTMTRLLQGLERDGYVRRRRAKGDGRVVMVTASARGRRALEAGRRARLRRVEALLDRVPADEHSYLLCAIESLETALAADDSSAQRHSQATTAQPKTAGTTTSLKK